MPVLLDYFWTKTEILFLDFLSTKSVSQIFFDVQSVFLSFDYAFYALSLRPLR